MPESVKICNGNGPCNLPNDKCPLFVVDRLNLFDKLKRLSDERFQSLPRNEIKIILPDGSIVLNISHEITPKELCIKHMENSEKYIVAKVNDKLWDLNRPLETDCQIKFITFDEPEGKHVFWHSSAHVLGEALELYYSCLLCHGPPVENGFFYDVYMGDRSVVGPETKEIEKLCQGMIKKKQKFERLVVHKDDLHQLFKENMFKKRILDNKVSDEYTTVYRCGSLIDLCRGPHLEHTGVIGAFSVVKNSSTYWEGKVGNESLQRIYGITFPTKQQLSDWKLMIEEAEKRDHRKLGREHELFFFHELSPGSCFFLPKGAHIYNKLVEFIRTEYLSRGFTEVISPNMYNVKLWKTSGHFDNYAENMFMFKIEDDEFALKPMNCPGHCIMYGIRPRSWKELPLRFADFGVLHRNEFSGALSGLTRVRRFCQDDAHIFCTLDQIGDEIKHSLDFLFFVHKILGFSVSIKLSTRPTNSIGDNSVWETAESELTKVLNESGCEWELNPGDGAFYGPKIDFQVKDALGRFHQLSTIQLDFNLPQRFQLRYVNSDDTTSQPVMIHRAILGSLERVIGILTESYAGKWPFWLSPNQIVVISFKPENDSYALSVVRRLVGSGFTCTLDNDPTVSFNKKIRNATQQLCNFIVIVGAKEQETESVSLRTRKGVQINQKTLIEVIEAFNKLKNSYANSDDLDFSL